ncbi:MAG: phosphonate ABC transporter ATP-binding protein [Verrucomicrobiales bacterium]|jgi:phosphonate transport system ATP-binding protein|nr:phosphonate ABC transporter ATP-binding protein [Verrucomicrobiales bacterium]
MSSAFELHGVTCRFRDLVAIDGVSLSIEKGEQLAFIGPSGSGKTTLIRLLNTTLLPDEGELSILGDDVADKGVNALRELRSRIGTMPQHLGLVENLTAIQNVILGRGGTRSTLRSIRDLLMPSSADEERIHQLLDRVGIEDKLYTATSKLSGGQKQRVAIARALFQEPKILLADEPVSAVDPARARDTVKLLTELSEEHGFTLCVSLHHLELAKEFFPRLVGLRGGKVVFDGSPDSLDGTELDALYELSDDEMMTDA